VKLLFIIFLTISPLFAQSGLGHKHTKIPVANPLISSQNYTMKSIETITGQVREYANTDGVVFAVVWEGGAPNFEKILGEYSEEYHAARKATAAHRGKNRTTYTPNIVVEHWGHMRDLHGRAYIRKLLPEGVKPSDLR